MKHHFQAHNKAVIASLLACVVLVLDALAASPGLHELVHKDANTPSHQCAVTVFAHGQVDVAVTEVVIPAPLDSVTTVPAFEISAYRPAIENLPAGRAPPVSFSNS